MKKLSKILLALVLLTYLLIVWGGVVRGSGSGLGCPDWPLCHGQWIPPFRQDVLIEYTHRLLASMVGFLTLGLSIFIWIKKELRQRFGKKCGVILALLFVQVLLGGVTVKSELHPYIVTVHLMTALIFLMLILHTYLGARDAWSVARDSSFGTRETEKREPSTERPVKWYRLSHWTLIALFFQILLGGLVAASNAGLACPDFPLCQGVWLPNLQGLVALQFLHRVVALLVFLMVLVLSAGLWKHPFAKNILLLVVLQILLGIANVLLGLPFWIRVGHLAVAIALFAALIWNTYELRRNIE